MDYAARWDEFTKPALIAMTVLGFIFWWPLGLAILAFTIWRKKMGCWHYGDHGYGRGYDRWHERAERFGEHMRGHAQRRAERWFRRHQERYSSGNRAFDEYRMETLRRLEEEQKEFMDFLDRLRMAKDKAEFDEFLNERRRRASEGPEAPPPA